MLRDLARPGFFTRLAWVFFTLALIFNTASLWILAGMLAFVLLLERYFRPRGEAAPPWLALLGGVVLFSSLRAFLVHRGSTVWFSLPKELPWVGGPITQEGFVESWRIALQVSLLMTWTIVSHRALPAREWLEAFPRALRPVSIYLMVGLRMIPNLRRTLEETRWMFQSRGVEFSGFASVRPLVSAWIHRSVEQSLAYAEVLEIRGAGLEVPPRRFDGRSAVWTTIQCLAWIGILAPLRGWSLIAAWLVGSLWIVGSR